MLCRIYSDPEVIDRYKQVYYHYVNDFVAIFVTYDEGKMTSRPFCFNFNQMITEVINLWRWIKFNPAD